MTATEPSSPQAYEPIAMSTESTVVAQFEPTPSADTAYQSEAALEGALIAQLEAQAYERLRITTEEDLKVNLRRQLEILNDVSFSDQEWARFLTTEIAGANTGIAEKTARIQQDHVRLLVRDDGTRKNIRLLDKEHIHNNRLQVLNQYETQGHGPSGRARGNRYDVTILVNGLPLVHIELKRRGLDLREAFNQIERYQRESFWQGSGLFEYVQLFVISNGTLTKYYSNTTRVQHLADSRGGRPRRRSTSNSYEFTSWWADATNRPIQDLAGFTKTFLAKHTLLAVLTRYCVLTEDGMLLVMRPYQIAATEQILQRITTSTNHRQLGTPRAGGYVWHTTGSGKTLTSFKTAQLVSRMPSVDKVLFVVDRKDLDYQTIREYDRFQEGAANSNTSTRVLKRQLEDPRARIIVTTIQKLATFVAANKGHAIYDGHVVVIFDECHRSQFGDMHTAITKAFRRYHLFGFTGTPIFAANAGSGGNILLRTTEQAFGDRLHTYTIVDAITDKNVLPFRIDYVNTVRMPAWVADKKVPSIEREQTLLAPDRMRQVAQYLLDHFDQKTKRTQHYALEGRRVRGFNAIFATASIEAARRYYSQIGFLQSERPDADKLKVALIYSYAPNAAADEDFLDDEGFDAGTLAGSDRDALEDAIADYNELFGTSFDTSGDRFENYYKDVSRRLKSRDLDLLIVVNMFLTGFDATTLNTLWLDKNLQSHGLVQAYSRTNRILNSVKTFGNIVSFRDLEEQTNEAIALFGNRDARGIVLLRPYADYLADYLAKVSDLLARFPLGSVIVGESAQKEFIALFGAILRLRNILTSFDDFEGDDPLSARQLQDYTSIYLDLAAEYRKASESDKESIIDDVVFEIELVKQVEISVDYILMLVERYRQARGVGEDREIRATIVRAVDSSPTLRNKRDLIEEFVDSVSATGDVDTQWQAFIARRREEELEAIIVEESLRPEETRAFVEAAFRDGAVATGPTLTRILPPMSRFAPDGAAAAKRVSVLGRLTTFFDRYFGIG